MYSDYYFELTDVPGVRKIMENNNISSRWLACLDIHENKVPYLWMSLSDRVWRISEGKISFVKNRNYLFPEVDMKELTLIMLKSKIL